MDSINTLEKQAIKAALNQVWDQAVSFNLEILKINCKDVPSLNRLGLALTKLNQINKAEAAYKQVLELDSQNIIATKCLQRLNKMDRNSLTPVSKNGKARSIVFLEEPGKTKVVKLVNLANPEILAQLTPGDCLNIDCKKRTICITTTDNVYLGALPEDLSSRLIILIKGGNKYDIFVKGAEPQNLIVFIRETIRSKRFHNRPSFSASSTAQLAYLEDNNYDKAVPNQSFEEDDINLS